MKHTKRVFMVLVLAGSALASPFSLGADISHPAQPLTLVSGSADYGATFAAGNMGSTFADMFTFSAAGPTALDAVVTSISHGASAGLDISSYDLYTSANLLVAHGTQVSSGPLDLWLLNAPTLTAGAYYLKVSGMVNSAGSGSFGGNVAVTALTPVPEPVTYGMLLGGLGLLGFLSRRARRSPPDA